MNYKELAEKALELEAKASKAPWIWDSEENKLYDAFDHDEEPIVYWTLRSAGEMKHRQIIETDMGHYGPDNGDAEFIAASRELVPQLAEAVLALHMALRIAVSNSGYWGGPTPEETERIATDYIEYAKLELKANG